MLIVPCTGARTDIEDDEGETPMQWVEEELADTDDPEEKQRYEKVLVDAHTIVICHYQ